MHTRKQRKIGSNRRNWMRLNVLLWIMVVVVAFFIVTIVVPGVLVNRIERPVSVHNAVTAPNQPEGIPIQETEKQATANIKQGMIVPVYLSKPGKVESVALEDYVRGVLAAEMPVDFELEALKAQALAARTYIYRRIIENDRSNVPVKDALVTDTTSHQAYLTDEALVKRWTGESYTRNMAKLTQAVEETRNLILTYEGKPINATFFSTSNGYTENAEEIWPFSVPYLKGVPSPWDTKSPQYKETMTLAYADVVRKLGVSSITISSNESDSIASSASSTKTSTKTSGMRVIERTKGGRNKKMSIGGTTFTGVEVREKLGLRSTSFDWKWKGTGKKATLEITTYGYGHGVGMSQWGADAMAKQGKTAEEIVRYYYQGIAISKASNIAN